MGVFDDIKKGSSTSSSGGGVFAQIKQVDDIKNQASIKQGIQKFGAPTANPANLPVVQQANQFVQNQPAPVHELTNTERFKDDPSRKIPVIGKILQGLDALDNVPYLNKIGEIGRALYTPGGGAANVAGLAGAAEGAVAKLLPKAAPLAQKAISSAATGVPLGVGQYQAQGGDNTKEAIKQGVFGALLGGGGSLAGPALNKVFSKLSNRSQNIATDVGMGGVEDWATKAKRAAHEYDQNATLGSNQDLNLMKIPKDVGSQYDAHGMAKGLGNDLDNLQTLLKNGIDNKKPFYSGRLSDEGHQSPFTNGSFVVTAGKGETLKANGIENVIVNDAYYHAIPDLQKEFPNVKFIRADEASQKLGSAISPQRQSIDEFVKSSQESAATGEPAIVGKRANFKNQTNNGNFSPELQQKINTTDQTYEKVTNKGSVDIANENVKNLPKAEAGFLLNESGGADHITTGYALMKRLDALGEHERALVVSKKLAEDLTKSGQTSQAASVLSRLSPEGQLLNLTRQAAKNGMGVTVKDSVKFKELAKTVQENAGAGIKANQFTEILDRAAKGGKLAPEDIKKMSDYLANAEKMAPKAEKVADDLPKELKEPRKRDRIVSYLDDAEQAALARIKARKNNLNALPLGEWADHAIVASSQIAKGTIKAATHVEDLVKLFGEEIRPVATKVFQKAQGILKTVSPGVSEGNLNKANQAFYRLSGKAAEEKAVVLETANHVKKLIADAKTGKLDPADIQKLRDYSDEIANLISEKPSNVPSQEQKFLQTVKSLSKKIAQVESESMPADQANREVASLLRQITKLTDEGGQSIKNAPIDNKALSDIAHDVMEKTRPQPKPTTLQEKIVEKYLKENPQVKPEDIQTLRDLAKNITRLSGDSKIDADIAMQKILNSYEKSTPWDKVKAIRYMAMLLNSGTQLVNAASGPIMATMGHAADVFGTMVDVAMHQTLRTPRSVTLYSSNPLRFMADYFKHLVKTGAPAGWHGVNPGGIQSAGEIRGLTFKSNYNPLNWAERTLGAVAKGTDYAAFKTVYDSEIRKAGFLDALSNGIKRSDRAAIKAHVEKFVNEPTEDAMLQADRIGKNTTFQRSDSIGGETANFLNSGSEKVKKYVSPVINSVIPFVKTPINMASSAVSMTPAGILKGLWQLTSKSKASQREAIRTLSLGVTGTFGTSAVGYYLGKIGIITGANDSGNKNVDATGEQAGQGKYRFNTSGLKRYMNAWLSGEGADAAEKAAKYQDGDHAFDYNKFQPIAFPLAIGASLGKSEGRPMLGRLASAGSDAYGSLFGMSTLKGVQDVFQPQYSGTQGEKSIGVASRIAESFFKSFSPSMLAQEARRQDPNVRKTPYNNGIVEDVKGYFQSRIPGLSKDLPASKTTLGLDKMNAAGFSGQYFNPYKSEVAAYSKAAAIIYDLIGRTGDQSIAPSSPTKKVTGKDKHGAPVSIDITQERYEQLQEEVGHAIIAKIMALPQGLTDAKKVEKIKQIYSDVNAKERNKVKKELGVH